MVFPYWCIVTKTFKNYQYKKALKKFTITDIAVKNERQLMKYIQHGQLTINNKRCSIDTEIHYGDVLRLFVHKHEPVISYPFGYSHPLGSLHVIHKNENVLVVVKPATIPTHGSQLYKKNSVLQMLKYNHYQYVDEDEDDYSGPQNNDKNRRTWTVHRLDKLVSGLLIFARNSAAVTYLKEQFSSRKVKKEYLALVHGRFDPHKYSHVNSKINVLARYSYRHVADDGVDAETYFELMWYDPLKNVSLVKAYPITGRTHQIRLHLSHVCGTPVVNDPLYNPSSRRSVRFEYDRDLLYAVNKENSRSPECIKMQQIATDKHFYCATCENLDYWCSTFCKSGNLNNAGIFLHSFRYTGENWKYQTPLPIWVIPKPHAQIYNVI
jgi:tRNA pseudouridine synthase 9